MSGRSASAVSTVATSRAQLAIVQRIEDCVGECSELENMLVQVSDAYDFQVKNKLEGLTGLMGPVVLVVMGFVVGIIVFAVMVPMFELTNAV